MMKWEYRATTIVRQDRATTLKRFNDIGLDSWELVSVDNGIAYFKRPIQPKSEAEILAQLDMKQVYSD